MGRLNRLQWLALVAGLGATIAYVLMLSWAMRTLSYASWGSMIVLPVLALLNFALIWLASRIETDRTITGLLVLGFVLKSLGVLARYLMVFFLYNGGDAIRYNNFGAEHWALWRAGSITWEETVGGEGTQALELITAALYTVIGPSPLAAFYVFGSFAFWGVYLIFRAFRIAVPDGHFRWYAALLFLLPSLLFWPSSIGKESWLLLFVGVFAYGVAHYFARRITGLAFAALGVLGVVLIRPHIAVLLVAAVGVAQLLRPTDRSPAAFLGKVVGAAVMGAGLIYMVGSAANFFGIQDVTADAVVEQVEWAGGQTQQGGSAFTPVPLTSPLGIPSAIITVLFRPFPWEAGAPLVAVQSIEGVALLLLLIRAWPRVRQLPKFLRSNPYVTFATAYVAGYILAFSGFGNFGILARQRVLMVPFFLILLALPVIVDKRKRAQAARQKELSRA